MVIIILYNSKNTRSGSKRFFIGFLFQKSPNCNRFGSVFSVRFGPVSTFFRFIELDLRTLCPRRISLSAPSCPRNFSMVKSKTKDSVCSRQRNSIVLLVTGSFPSLKYCCIMRPARGTFGTVNRTVNACWMSSLGGRR